MLLEHSQTERHKVLTLACVGSNPTVPAILTHNNMFAYCCDFLFVFFLKIDILNFAIWIRLFTRWMLNSNWRFLPITKILNDYR